VCWFRSIRKGTWVSKTFKLLAYHYWDSFREAICGRGGETSYAMGGGAGVAGERAGRILT
jgi:hypothetical protein